MLAETLASSQKKCLDLHGYIHCMPYGKVEFVIKLSPLHPGYVIMVCAEMRDVQRAISDRIWGNIMAKADKARMNRQCWSHAGIRAETSKICRRRCRQSFSQRRRRRGDEVEYEERSRISSHGAFGAEKPFESTRNAWWWDPASLMVGGCTHTSD